MKVPAGWCIVAAVAILCAPGVRQVSEDRQSHLPLQLQAYGTTALDLSGFSRAAKAPRITDKRYSPDPQGTLSARYAELFGSSPKPGRVVSAILEYARPATNEHVGATLRIGTNIYSDGQYASLIGDPSTRSVSRVGAYRRGTYSGYGLGQASWVTTSAGRPELDRSLKITAVDGKVVAAVDLWLQPTNTTDRNPGWRPLTDLDYQVSEFAARLALSYGRMADLDFERAPKVEITVRNTRIDCRTPGDLTLAPLRSVLRAVGGSLDGGEFGVYRASVGGRSLRIVIASRELVVDQRKIALSCPILFDGTELWIEKNAVLSALRL